MKRVIVVCLITISTAIAAVAVDRISRARFDDRVWRCYESLGSGSLPLKEHFELPRDCQPTSIAISRVGEPNAFVDLQFAPPRMMWVSYVTRSVSYDSYVIVIQRRGGAMRAKIHHHSD